MIRYLIGIDPGVNTGISVWDRKRQRVEDLAVMSYWEAIEFVERFSPKNTELRIEDPDQISHVWDRPMPAGAGKYLPASELMIHHVRRGQMGAFIATMRKLIKIAQNVGMNKCDGKRLIEYFRLKGYTVKAVNPKNLGKKWTHAQFVMYTGLRDAEYKKKKYQHAIDGCRLVVGY